MAVDEFGREIPAARNAGRRSPSPHRRMEGGGGGGLPSHLYDPLPTSRYDGAGDRDRDRDRGGDDRNSSRKRKHRSRSPPPRRDRNGDGRNDRDSSHNQKSTKPHPSVIYVEEPMLCQYLWKEANEGKSDEDYDEYRKSYCLNFVRTFFNEHMDDSWFRSLYSPLERYEVELQERRRAAKAASDISQELESSLAKTISSANSNERDPSFFVLKARLGGGVRQTGKQDYQSHHSPSKSSRQSSLVNPIPATHVLALTSQVLPIQEVPHYVTDEQLTVALMQQVSSKTSKEVDPSSTVLYSGLPTTDLTRTCYLQATDEVRKEIIQTLNHSDRAAPVAKSGKDGASHVPRKEDTFVPKTLELIVECSDAYGRLEVDADGKGGEPEERGGVPPRKGSVWISTRSLTPNVQVLSAALSSTKRIKEDQIAALKLAKAYDIRRDIPAEFRLETLLPKAVPNIASEADNGDGPPPQAVEDALDVTISYLRRVHLFSYYNGCQSAPRVAEVFNGNHAVSTIHLRLANADEMLAEPIKDATGAPIDMENTLPKIDLLSQRLNDSIERALKEAEDWITPGADQDGMPSTCIIIDKEVDRQAQDIKYQESQVEDRWIEDHALIDEDGRARCAFHFCRKLFKDSSFLKKHLIKKHSEFLRAEIAKCHDSYMMTSWDAQSQRPVPPILVDCGHRFGLKPSPVLGAAEPIAEDPEPELWKREEERRELQEKEAEARRERYNNSQNYNNNNDGPTLDSALLDGRGQGRKSNFEDVDDMKVEKVEIAFDKIEIPVQPPKKKKKKKKLL